MKVVSNQNKLANNYLVALEAKKLPPSISYLKAVYQANLDFSNASLNRIDSLLLQLQKQQNPDKHTFFNSSDNKQFMFLLGIYIGEYIARIIDKPTTWYAGKDYYAGKEKLISQPENLLIVEIVTLIKPLNFLSIRLFTQKDLTLKEWISKTIANQLKESEKRERISEECFEDLEEEFENFQPSNQTDISDADLPTIETNPHLTPQTLIDTEQSDANHTIAKNAQNNSVISSHSTPSSSMSSPLKTNPDSHMEGNQIDGTPFKSKQKNISNHIKTRSKKKKPNRVQRNTNTETEMIDTRTAYAEKLDINYNGNFIERFRLPIKSRIIASVPLVIILLYQCFGIFQKYDDTGKLSIIGIVFAVIYLLVLILIWVHYALSWVNVFDNKVSKSSPLKNEIAYFDKRVRFFHVQGDDELLGVKNHVLIKTNAESIKLMVKNHDDLQDLLLTLEADLLVDKMLAQIDAGDTLIFNLVKLNKQEMTYGNQTQPISALGDVDFDDNFLLLYLNNGDRFAKIDMNNEPNINSMMMVLEALKSD